MNSIQALVRLLEDPSTEVQTNAVGALSEFVRFEGNTVELRRCGGIPLLVAMLSNTHVPLLEHVPTVLRECASEQEAMTDIEKLDGVRLVWSLLKNKSPKVIW